MIIIGEIIASIKKLSIKRKEKSETEKFHQDHLYPDQAGLNRLYRYMKYDPNKQAHIEDLLIHKKLYHNLPGEFNDPFECKPHFILPKSRKDLHKIGTHLYCLALKYGASEADADLIVKRNLENPENLRSTIADTAKMVYGELRICCYTTNNDNLLLWSHYGDSHKGFCLEFDASITPFACAFGVKYCEEYPTIEYPRPLNVTAFKPALVKSKAWSYENEFRTIFTSDVSAGIYNDGKSAILHENSLTGVYFGANMDERTVDSIIEIINRGPFKPNFWKASLSDTSFELSFNKLKNKSQTV